MLVSIGIIFASGAVMGMGSVSHLQPYGGNRLTGCGGADGEQTKAGIDVLRDERSLRLIADRDFDGCRIMPGSIWCLRRLEFAGRWLNEDVCPGHVGILPEWRCLAEVLTRKAGRRAERFGWLCGIEKARLSGLSRCAWRSEMESE